MAESTGKEGKGILPVVGEAVGDGAVYGDDRLFVQFVLAGDAVALPAGQPSIRIELDDVYALGGQFMVWELATAVSSHLLDVQPFDQPNVESAKVVARQMIAAYMETGALPPADTVPYSEAAMEDFLADVKAGDYISLHAYMPTTAETTAVLTTMQAQLRARYKVAVTVGYGPRFLHSTGQLHKGDGGNGLFVQMISAPVQDVAIPDEAGSFSSSMSFGTLKASQAMGDAAALRDAGRRVIAFAVDSL